uniref:Uncharacterized protein n=1 Tax=Nelumbo nucifera TaxID=4432 RepID=A0A822XP32_NELNU|nr:TPA_asm: hypothetical protein HUJ06_024837 [Nelumbo nucifera]
MNPICLQILDLGLFSIQTLQIHMASVTINYSSNLLPFSRLYGRFEARYKLPHADRFYNLFVTMQFFLSIYLSC